MTDLETILKLQRDYTTLIYDIKNVFLFASNLLGGKCDFLIPEPENSELCGIMDRFIAFSERLKKLENT